MNTTSLHILLIEDNPGDTVLIEELLAEISDVSFVVETADRLSTGLARLDRGGIDVVLLDLGLPDSQGLETIERLMAHPSATIPTIILTGSTSNSVGFDAVRMGAQDYLTKGSFDGAGLARTIRYALERFKATPHSPETRVDLRTPSEGFLSLLMRTDFDLSGTSSVNTAPAEVSDSDPTDILTPPKEGNGDRGKTEITSTPSTPSTPRDAVSLPDPSAQQATPGPRTTPYTDGRIQVEGVIARGGMGVILKGWDTRLRREVAIKILRREHLTNSSLVERFVQEARITGRLQHPGIISVTDLGETSDGRPCFTMSLVRGQTLDHILNHRSTTLAAVRRFLVIFEKVAQAVAYAHAQGVIHRDIKPANVMVGAFGLVQLLDWGLAKVLGEDELPIEPSARAANAVAKLSEEHESVNGDSAHSIESGTQIGTVFGTPSYLPPEQARGEIHNVDKRADVFGLGGILCQILTGKPPYTGAKGKEVFRKARGAELTEAYARLDACPAEREIIALAKRCLSVEPDDRPADGGEVATTMTAYLEFNSSSRVP